MLVGSRRNLAALLLSAALLLLFAFPYLSRRSDAAERSGAHRPLRPFRKPWEPAPQVDRKGKDVGKPSIDEAVAAEAAEAAAAVLSQVLQMNQPTTTTHAAAAKSDPTPKPKKVVTPHFDDTGLPNNRPGLPAEVKPQHIDDEHDHLADPAIGDTSHPIDELVRRGREQYVALKKKRVKTLEAAAAAYRERRGRHPPPGFDKWWAFSQQKGAIIIEDTFDQIYHDLEPFWGLDPELIRETSKMWHEQVTIRNGSANEHMEEYIYGAWLIDWRDMLRHLDGLLPDVDLAFNNLDESRIMVPWEKIDKYVHAASKSKNVDKPTKEKPLVTTYQTLPPLPTGVFNPRLEHEWEDWHNDTLWEFVRKTCPPKSEARQVHGARGNDNTSPFFPPTDLYPVGSYHGYVGNWTFARSACDNPSLRKIHGNFINPRWVSVNQSLFPLFGGSKMLGVNNEIIVPAAKYWATEVEFTGEHDNEDDDAPMWELLIPKAIWRGAASGGDHNETNWRKFHRHRFVGMMNGTQVTLTERKLSAHDAARRDDSDDKDPNFYDATKSKPHLPHNFPMPNPEVYPLGALKTTPTSLGEWSGSMNDGGFTHFMCHPQHISQFGEGTECFYFDRFYNWTAKMDMQDQFMHKYLPDIDGNSYSGRYRAFLRSGSLPIKSTVYTEWHDARLIPWVHFVPMDNSYADYWGILEYFAGYEQPVDSTNNIGAERIIVPGHDNVARDIAMEGKRWSGKVLRHSDMLVYMHRLVLEYARITNDQRDNMGWADDLLHDAGESD